MSRVIESGFRFKLTPVKFAKLCACFYVIVSKALLPIGFVNGTIQLGFLLVTVLATVWVDHGRPKLNKFLRVELVFIILTTLTSLSVAKSIDWVLNCVLSLIYGIMFGYAMIRISIEEKSIDWFVKSIVSAGVILSGYILLTGGYSAGRLVRVSTSEELNTNTLGVFMTVAIWATLYLISEYSHKQNRAVTVFVFGFVLIAVFMYIMLGTGSRKSLIASSFVIIFWIVFAMVNSFKQLSFPKRLLLFVIAGGLVIILLRQFSGTFSDISTTVTKRMQLLSEENITDMHRFDLIVDAIKIFFSHLIFGVGWNNYRLYSFSSQYSHCAYVEVLACTGIVGSALAYYLWAIQIKNIIALAKSKSDRVLSINTVVLLAVFIFINAVQIMYYNTTLLMVMHLLVCIPIVNDVKTKSID